MKKLLQFALVALALAAILLSQTSDPAPRVIAGGASPPATPCTPNAIYIANGIVVVCNPGGTAWVTTGGTPTVSPNSLFGNPTGSSAPGSSIGLVAPSFVQNYLIAKFPITSAPGSIAGNEPLDIAVDSTNHNVYICGEPAGTSAPACGSVSLTNWIQLATLAGTQTHSGINTFSGNLDFTGLATGTQVSCLGLTSANAVVAATGACGSGSSSPAFSALTSGTNTIAGMFIGTGASLGVTGSGTIAATSAPLSGITGLGTGLATAFALTPSGTGSVCLTSGSTCGGGTAVTFAYNGSSVGSMPTGMNLVPSSGWSCTPTFPLSIATYTCGNDGTLQTLLGGIAGTGGGPTGISATGGASGTLVAALSVFTGGAYIDKMSFNVKVTDANVSFGSGPSLNVQSTGTTPIYYLLGGVATAAPTNCLLQNQTESYNYSSNGGIGGSAGFKVSCDGIPTPVPNGGTGLSSLTANAIYKGAGASALALSSLTDSGTILSTSEAVLMLHIKSSTAPTVAAGGAISTTPTISGSDFEGTVSVPSSAITTGTVATVTFGAAYGVAPNCLVAQNGGIVSIGAGHGTPGTTSFTITAAIANVSAAAYQFDYVCSGN